MIIFLILIKINDSYFHFLEKQRTTFNMLLNVYCSQLKYLLFILIGSAILESVFVVPELSGSACGLTG